MNDDSAHNRPQPEGGEGTAGQHLSADNLNAYFDGELSAAARSHAESHLQSCAACRRDLADLRTTVTLLRGLPEQRPRRSFLLSPELARTSRTSWFLRLMPSLPALRTATAVVAMLLVAVIAGDVWTNQGDEPDRTAQEAPSTDGASREFEPAGAAPALTATAPAPTTSKEPEAALALPTPTAPPPAQAAEAAPITPTRERMSAFTEAPEESAADEEAPPAAPAADSAADEEIASDEGDSSAADDQAAGAGSGASGEAAAQSIPPTATATPNPTATPLPTATPSPVPSPSSTPAPTATASPTPAPTPTPVAQPSSDGGSRPSLWRIAEIGLGLLLAWLIVSIIGIRRLRRS
ncbi:MAG: anti-sigma factor family protein [Thermomicrobiales bacterium]